MESEVKMKGQWSSQEDRECSGELAMMHMTIPVLVLPAFMYVPYLSHSLAGRADSVWI